METILRHTRNSLPEKTRIEVIALLQARLADSIDLMMQAKQAHWNLKGPHFFSLHGVFDKVYSDTGTYVDLISSPRSPAEPTPIFGSWKPMSRRKPEPA